MSTISYIEESATGFDTIPLESRLITDRKIFIEGAITTETAVDFTKQMMYLSKSDEPVYIYINSTGGEVNAGLAIYDIIQGFQGEIQMYCIGQAYSMAAVLLAAGQKGKRFILPHSLVMIHEVLLGRGISGSATSISRISQSVMETRDIVNGILSKHTGKSIELINKATSFDNCMNAMEAVKFGICDKIIDTIF